MKFSIFNLLLIITAVAAIVGLFALRQANFELKAKHEAEVAKYSEAIAALESERQSLRQELGYLTINPKDRIHAAKIGYTTANTWKYKAYLPEGQNYYVAARVNSLPLGGKFPVVAKKPKPSTISTIDRNSVAIGCEPGLYVVSLVVFSDNGQWKYHLKLRKDKSSGSGSTGGQPIDDFKGKWPEQADWIASSGITYERDFPADQNCLLLDFRANAYNVKDSSKSDQGAMLWIGSSD